MAYTTPATKATGDLLSATDWNTYVRDDMEYLNARAQEVAFKGVRIVRTTNQSIPDSALTTVTWPDGETFDEGGWFSGTGGTVTVPSGAIPSGFTNIVVQVSCYIFWDANATGRRYLSLLKNGTEFTSGTDWPQSANTFAIPVSAPINVASGDTITVEAFQSSGGALNIENGALAVVRLGAY